MPAKLSSASFQFGVTPGHQPKAAVLSNSPKRFNIAVLGDFSGRANRAVAEPLAGRKLLHVDCDNLPQAFAQLGAGLRIPDGASPVASIDLTFSTLEDFHPDRLLSRTEPLAKLLEARSLLLNPSTAEQGKGALEAYLGAAVAAPANQTQPEPPRKIESDDETLGRLLGGARPAGSPPVAARSLLEDFIRQTVAPHVSPAGAPWQQGALAAVDIELAARLRAILHHPDFQALEAAWRGVDFLVRRIEAAEEIGVLVLDVSAAELEVNLAATEPAKPPELLRLLRDRRISLFVGNFLFGQSPADLRTLSGLARTAADLEAPFLGTASPRLVGCDSFGRHPDPDDWKSDLAPETEAAYQELRKTAQANCVGLAAPRFLLRQPYGESGDAIESFPFEELPGEPGHEHFLWGHPGIACACLLAEASPDQDMEEGGEPDLPTSGEVGDLPAHKFTEDGETVIKPYAEAWLTERASDRMIARGIIPLFSRKDYNSIRIPGFFSVALPPGPLPVRWH